MRSILCYVIMLAAAVSPALATAQEDKDATDLLAELRQDALLNGRYPLAFQDVITIFNRPDVQKELEIGPDQLKEFKKTIQPFRFKLQEELSALQPIKILGDSEAKEQQRELMVARQEKKTEVEEKFALKLDEILLAHQSERLKQIVIQAAHADPVFVSAYTSKFVAERTKLDEKQQKKLQAIGEDMEKQYLADLRKLKMKYHKKVRKSMGNEAAKAIQDLLGDPFVTDPRTRFRR